MSSHLAVSPGASSESSVSIAVCPPSVTAAEEPPAVLGPDDNVDVGNDVDGSIMLDMPLLDDSLSDDANNASALTLDRTPDINGALSFQENDSLDIEAAAVANAGVMNRQLRPGKVRLSPIMAPARMPFVGPSTPENGSGQPSAEELLAIEPVETDRESDYYRSKIERAKQKIEKKKQRRQLTESDPQVAFEKYLKAHTELVAYRSTLETVDGNEESLIDDSRSRKTRWRQFRDKIAQSTNASFNEILNTNDMYGHLEFMHGDEIIKGICTKVQLPAKPNRQRQYLEVST